MTKRKVAQPDLIDLLLADYKKPEDLLGEKHSKKHRVRPYI